MDVCASAALGVTKHHHGAPEAAVDYDRRSEGAHTASHYTETLYHCLQKNQGEALYIINPQEDLYTATP